MTITLIEPTAALVLVELQGGTLANPAIQAYLSANGVSVKKVIVVQDRIVNLVVG